MEYTHVGKTQRCKQNPERRWKLDDSDRTENNVLLIDRGHTLITTAESRARLLKSGVSVFSVPWN